MKTRWTLKTTAALAAVTMALAAPALGAPAGDEYLPNSPQAGGSGSSDGGGDGSSTSTVPGEGEGKKAADAKSKKDKKENKDETTAAASGGSGGDGDDSSGLLDTLTDPIVLLLIAGVAVTALGMILRHRHGGDGADGPTRAPRDRSAAPPTPDGEIVGDERT